MTQDWTVPAWAVVAILVTTVVLAVLVVIALVRLHRVSGHLAALLSTAVLGAPAPAPAPAPAGHTAADAAPAEPASYVITRLGDATPAPVPVPVVPPGVFAEAVVREGALRTAALLHGVRRALAPQVRARIRAEMRTEVKRARKVRRAEQRVALREWQARQRAEEAA